MQSEQKQSAPEASIISLSIFIALSLGVIGVLVTQTQVKFGYNATTVGSASLVLAIALFLFSLEFFILCVSHPDRVEYFGFIGSTLYGIGVTSMIVGISLTLKAFQMCFLSYLFLSLLLVGYGVYYAIRIRSLGFEEPRWKRVLIRVICFAIIIAGYPLVTTVGG